MVKKPRQIPYLEINDDDGNKISVEAKGDALENFLERMDDNFIAKRIRSSATEDGESVELTEKELEIIRRIEENKYADASYDPYEPFEDFFTSTVQVTPLSSCPEPKSRFVPSKWEEKRIKRLVCAIRSGAIKMRTEDAEESANTQKLYDIWASNDASTASKAHSRISAPKVKLPDHAESYNPPEEYLPTAEEAEAWKNADATDRKRNYLPQKFKCFRHVRAYSQFVQERFSRCLDLYLCPRAMRKRTLVDDPKDLLPVLPSVDDLRPFPTKLAVEYVGHSAAVRSTAVDSSGNWLLSGAADGAVRLWEVESGRCHAAWNFEDAVSHVAWSPASGVSLFAVATGSDVHIVVCRVNGEEITAASMQAIAKTASNAAFESPFVSWDFSTEDRIVLRHKHTVNALCWHPKGDYFGTVASSPSQSTVLIHHLAKQKSQNPFKKSSGLVQSLAFHPYKPQFVVETARSVRIYNVSAKDSPQFLDKKLTPSVAHISCMGLHASGDHILVGSHDKKVVWLDVDLAATPYKVMRHHAAAIRSVAFHRTHPLFASCGDDGTVQIFHGKVFDDLMRNPLIVPLHIIRFKPVNVASAGCSAAVLACAWHPQQPWIFAASEDGSIRLFS